MTGLGYFGSSSSSNLSPLAPPFTVDRANYNKPALNSNPIAHLNDPSSYQLPFASSSSSSLAFSQSTGGQEFFGDLPKTSSDYGYVVPDTVVVDSSITHNWGGLSSHELGPAGSRWSGVNPSSKRVADSLVYNLGEAEPSVRKRNDETPFSDGTDYTRSLSGLEYSHNPNPNLNWKQEGVSSSRLSLPEEKPVKRNNDSFFLGDGNIASAASFAYDQAAYSTEALSQGKNDPSMLYYADIIRRANNNGKSDGTSFFANNQHHLGLNEFSKEEPNFGAFPVFSEPHPSLPEDPFWNSQKLIPPYEKGYHHMLKSKKSTPVVIKSPVAAGSACSASSKSFKIGNTAGGLDICDAVVGSSHKSLKEKEELHLPQLSFQMGTSDTAPFSIKDTKLPSTSDKLNFEFKARPSVLQIPDINIPDAASSIDNHNSAEDSPCWEPKGTPFLPFGSTQTQPSTKNLQKDKNLQETDYSYNNHEKTSPSPMPSHNDTGEVVNSLKVGDGGEYVVKQNKPQTSKMKLSNIEEAAIFLAEISGEAADKKLDASILVKSLYNLSDLLLQACSNEALKEHDYEALDHVTRNLGVCMLKQVQVTAASTNKLMSPHLSTPHESQVIGETSGTLQDGGQHADYQKMKPDAFGESVKNILEHASLRDLDPPKGDNMVQAIKKVLDENLESEVQLPSNTTLLYKNLWLEAEAELCCLSYRARFERLKRETQKEKPHNSTATGGASTIKETLTSCNGTTSLKVDNDIVSNAQHIGGIINVHGEQNPVKEGHAAAGKVTDSGVTVQHQPFKDDDDNGSDPWVRVVARSNTRKHRGESNAIDLEEGACGEERESHFQHQEAATVGSGSDWEHILKDEFSGRTHGVAFRGVTKCDFVGSQSAFTIKETLTSCNGTTSLKVDNDIVSNAQHIGGIINVHGEQNPVKEGHAAAGKVTDSGVTVQHQPFKDDDDNGSDPWVRVVARSNTRKHRGESNAIDLEEGACGEERESHFQNQEAATVGSGSDWEHILKDEFSGRLT
ncbi:hypothetical protein SSX86_008108 [Deinandra increscens subsp. villosa]|uniref:Uncharacterized protein n=1 Tax=Deinandra increscens subsp. villosa TaxID=3103831 RepID=A0AAP0DIG6_9ASTR